MNLKEATQIIFDHFQGTGLNIGWRKAARIAGPYLAGKLGDSDLPADLQNKLNYFDPTGDKVARKLTPRPRVAA